MALIEQNVLVTTKYGKCPSFAACPDAPEEMLDYTRNEISKLGKVIRAAGLKIEG